MFLIGWRNGDIKFNRDEDYVLRKSNSHVQIHKNDT